jgi:hypothetical protein
MAELRLVVTGAREVREAMQAAPKQARFAAARALTDVVQETQRRVVDQLGSDFTIRSGWVAKGIRVVMANPHDLEAVIGSKDDFMERQEVGGAKTPQDGRAVAAPIAARKSRTDITRPSKWPGHLKQGFIAPLSTAGLYMGMKRRRHSEQVRRSRSHLAPNGHISKWRRMKDDWAGLDIGVWERYGPKVTATRGRYKGRKRQRIRLMYALEQEVQVHPHWHLRKIAEEVSKERFLPAFRLRFAEALASTR